MKRVKRIFIAAALAALAAGCLPPPIDDGYDDGYYDDCDYYPDLAADSFTFTDTLQAGTVLTFQDITLCNWADATADPGHEYAILLSQSADLSGTSYVLFQSEPLVGIAPWDCVSFSQSVSVGAGIPEGYYYVIVYADFNDAVDECNENDNWARSDDAIYIVPDSSEPL